MERPTNVPPDYGVGQRLGAGQTSVVWLATQESTGRLVALKLPRPEAQTNLMLRRMFENEVQITLKLDHPNVVRAFDGRPTGQHAFLALEYCEGGTLDQLLLEQGRLPLERALQLVLDTAAGLEHTHELRVLHRDVKPANVFLDGEGRAKLGDFGTGTFAAEDSQERVGTAFYMAPEIFEGASPSVQSDVYSLGVLAYEVLTGTRPFVGDSYDALMVAHLTSLPRDIRHVRPDLPRGVGVVVTRAMSRDATRRFQSVTEFLEAFRRALTSTTSTGTAPGTTTTAAATASGAAAGKATGVGAPPGRGGRVRATGEWSDPPEPGAAPEPERDAPVAPEQPRRGLFAWLRRRSK